MMIIIDFHLIDEISYVIDKFQTGVKSDFNGDEESCHVKIWPTRAHFHDIWSIYDNRCIEKCGNENLKLTWLDWKILIWCNFCLINIFIRLNVDDPSTYMLVYILDTALFI